MVDKRELQASERELGLLSAQGEWARFGLG